LLEAFLPVVFFGEAIAKHLPLAIVRKVTAALFAVLGIFALIGTATSSSPAWATGF
jgi:putative Ca2+/H+ antiporter (TMEM165/GDT1 family)